MNRHYRITGPSGAVLVDNLVEKCHSCVSDCTKVSQVVGVCPQYGDRRIQGVVNTRSNSTFLCDQTKTTKLFRSKIEALAYCVSDLKDIGERLREVAKEDERRRFDGLLHNLRSINARSIQQMYEFDQNESTTTKSTHGIIDRYAEQLKKEPYEGAKLVLRVTKNNLLMRSEFSAFDKLERTENYIDGSMHEIRRVILNVLHAFLDDFSSRSIRVDVKEYDRRICIDYDSVQVALVTIIENAAKYAKTNSVVEIAFSEVGDALQVIFTMMSLHVAEGERARIFEEGFSGSEAMKSEKSGRGLGMWMAQRMLQMNRATITMKCGDDLVAATDEDGARQNIYSTNSVVVVFRA